MTDYYNEIDPFAADWLENLIAAGHLAPGVVDRRDIRDVRPADLRGFVQCHFFAGIGIWPYAARRAGWPADRRLWTGSCPCQPFSAAGAGAGFDDERHLWPFWHHLIRVERPPDILGEQVASKPGFAWLDLVQADLEALDYACGAVVLPAASVGAPHERHRTWFVAHANDAERRSEKSAGHDIDGPTPERDQSHRHAWQRLHGPDWLAAASEFSQDAHGDRARMGRLCAYGNAINAEAAEAVVRAYLDHERAALGGGGRLEAVLG